MIFTNNALYDRIINITLYKQTKEDPFATYTNITAINKVETANTIKTNVVLVNKKPILHIECPVSGPKPDISLSFGMVPGRTATQCDVTITNLQADNEKLQEATLMEIVAGYANGHTITLNVNILAVWCESPNPDGVTHIQGLPTGESVGKFFGNAQYQISFYKDTITLGELLTRLLKDTETMSQASFDKYVQKPFLDVVMACDKDGTGVKVPTPLKDWKFKAEKVTVYANSAYEIIQWLGVRLYDWGRSHDMLIYCRIFNDDVHINVVGKLDPSTPFFREDIVELHVIEQASFTASVLTVVAPWTPELIPGNLFKLSANYYKLQNTPTLLNTPAMNRRNDGVYRAISVEVKFSTNGGTNSMSVTAVPFDMAMNPWDAQNAYIEAQNDKTEETAQKQAADGRARNNSLWVTIVFGSPEDELPTAEPQGSIWGKFGSIGLAPKWINAIKTQALEEPTPVFNGSNWKPFFYKVIDFKEYWTRDVTNSDGNYITSYQDVYVPYLKRSELKKAGRVGSIPKFTMLNPACLWPLSIVYAYSMSKQRQDYLYKALDKQTFGNVARSVINMPMEEGVAQCKQLPVSKWPKELTQSLQVAVPEIWLNKSPTGIEAAPLADGGSRDFWVNAFKPFVDAMKVLIDSGVLKELPYMDADMFELWHFFLSEVAK